MPTEPAEHAQPASAPALDFDALRARAIGTLQRLAGQTWTDHNSHDPGITVLEAVCYAITDLAYRSSYPVQDLLASLPVADGAAASGTHGLFSPAQVLPSGPVTADDLRRLVIDLPGVKNAWVEPVDTALASHDAAQGLLAPLGGASAPGASAASPNRSPLRPRGLVRVWIEKSGLADAGDGGALVRLAAQRLQQWRALGEDIADIQVLDPLPVALDGAIELAPGADAGETLAALFQALAQHLSPALPWRSLREMLARGWRADQIFEGPLLQHGFLDPDEWAAARRLDSVRVSDLLQVVMAVPGVAAVKRLGLLRDGRPSSDWLLPIPDGRCASFDMPGSRLQLERGGLRIDHPALRAQARRLFEARQRRAAQAPQPAGDDPLAPPPGRARQVARYLSLQHHLPQVYGVGPAGLSGQEPPERHAQARQLKAYLMLFDQLLCNQFAQLGQAGQLLAFSGGGEAVRFAQPVPDDGGALQLASVRRLPLEAHARWLEAINHNPWGDADSEADAARLAQRHRLADHLLARLGEHWGELRPVGDAPGLADGPDPADAPDAPSAGSPRQRALRDKQAYLQDYPRLALRRGLGADALALALPDGAQPASAGLQQRLARLLGLADAALPLHLVEHILLRPLPADSRQHGPLMRAALSADPFSLQISLVLPADDPRWADADLRQRLAHAAAQEAPAHLALRLLWLAAPALAEFGAALATWRGLRAADLRRQIGLDSGDAAPAGQPDTASSPNAGTSPGTTADTAPGDSARQVALRSARNRVIDALGLGDTFPLTDLRVADGVAAAGPGAGLKVAHGRSARIAIDAAEAGVVYALRSPDGGPLRNARGELLAPVQAEGRGGRLLLESPPITDDIRFRVQASKLRAVPGLPAQPPVLLDQAAPVRVGLDTSLAVLLPDLPLLDGRLANPLPGDARLCHFGQAVRVQVLASQEGVAYSLVVDGQPQGQVVIGDLETITLTSPALHEDATLAVQAVKRLGSGDAAEPEPQLLDARLRVAVRADPAPLAPLPAAVVDFRQAGAALRLQASQASASYRLWVRRVRDAEWLPGGVAPAGVALLQAAPAHPGVLPPAWGEGGAPPPGFVPLGPALPGTGADLLLPLGAPSHDLVCLVQASKQHAGRGDETIGSDTGLAQALLLLVRPDPQPALQLVLVSGLPAGADAPTRLRVQGGQPGVAYGFTPQPDGPALPLPAYVHQRDDSDAGTNQGLGQLVIGIDLAVATDPALPPAAPLPSAQRAVAAPELDLPALAAGTRLALQAVKVHTGVQAAVPMPAQLPALAPATLRAGWLAPGAPAQVALAASLVGTRYQLWHQGLALGEPVAGTGGPLQLDTGALTPGEAPEPGPGPEPLHDAAALQAPVDGWLVLRSETPADGVWPIATEQWLLWRQLPRADLGVVARSTRLAAGEATDILLAASQPGVRYQLLGLQQGGAAPQPVGVALAGQGRALALPTGPLQADVRLQVQASRSDDPAGSVILAAELLVQVQQPPPPADPPADPPAEPPAPPADPAPVPPVDPAPVPPAGPVPDAPA